MNEPKWPHTRQSHDGYRFIAANQSDLNTTTIQKRIRHDHSTSTGTKKDGKCIAVLNIH